MLPSILLSFLLSATPIAKNVAPACATNATCTFTDTNVSVGSHTYFVEAVNSSGVSSGPSNSVSVVVPADGNTHNAVLNWNPSTTAGVSYSIYQTAPPVNVVITSDK
jgi:hypothetical protein